MPITRTPWTDDDGTGTTGTIINNAEKTILYNQIDALVEPAVIAIPYASLIFGGGLTVTAVQLSLSEYIRHGREVHIRMAIDAATVGAGAAPGLTVSGLPFAFSGNQTIAGVTSLASAGGWGTFMVKLVHGATYISFNRYDFGAWPAAAGFAYFYLDILAPVI